jgi:hypothetical protein
LMFEDLAEKWLPANHDLIVLEELWREGRRGERRCLSPSWVASLGVLSYRSIVQWPHPNQFFVTRSKASVCIFFLFFVIIFQSKVCLQETHVAAKWMKRRAFYSSRNFREKERVACFFVLNRSWRTLTFQVTLAAASRQYFVDGNHNSFGVTHHCRWSLHHVTMKRDCSRNLLPPDQDFIIPEEVWSETITWLI